ncbi:hypothetical protein NECAME_14413 [Necator americanus]|uniref:CHK kinase-like domain-containing protein n=1 Tax=Necator americanus TaxID=51031 RepID=W2SMV6_NECAM|nr:hypothetical protein NECAME_14413 [Necator americanus]ETN70980.1 hypothetical protein NECAME_14413 [Necator americanus]
MECYSAGVLPQKIIVKIPTCLTYVENRKRRGWSQGDYTYVKELLKQYHNTETLFYKNAHDIPGVPRTFLCCPLGDDDRAVICMEYLENSRTLPVYENISVEQMKSVLNMYAGIQYHCRSFSDDICTRMNRNVFEILSGTTLSLKCLFRCSFNALTGCLHGHLKWGQRFVRSLRSYRESSITMSLQNYILLAMSHFGNPVEDLIRLFCTGLDPTDRKNHTTTLLMYYCPVLTSLLPDLKDIITTETLTSWYNEIIPIAGLWTMVSLHASFEAVSFKRHVDETRAKTVVEKIHGIALNILEKLVTR